MGTEKGNEGSGGTEGREGSEKPRLKLCWFKNQTAHKAFFIYYYFLTERGKTSDAHCVFT